MRWCDHVLCTVPQNKTEEADRVRRNLAGESRSDHIAIINAFQVSNHNAFNTVSSPSLTPPLPTPSSPSHIVVGLGEAQADRLGCCEAILLGQLPLSADTRGLVPWQQVNACTLILIVCTCALQMLFNMKKQFAGLLHDAGFLLSASPSDPQANHNAGVWHTVPTQCGVRHTVPTQCGVRHTVPTQCGVRHTVPHTVRCAAHSTPHSAVCGTQYPTQCSVMRCC